MLKEKKFFYFFIFIALIIGSLAVLFLINKDNFRNNSTESFMDNSVNKTRKISLEGRIVGSSYDSTVSCKIGLSGIKICLEKIGSDKKYSTISNKNGRFFFSNIEKGNYIIRTENNQKGLIRYYQLFSSRIHISTSSLQYKNIFLIINKKALRDLDRQNSFFIYQDILKDYKRDNGHYPVAIKGIEITASSKLFNDLKYYAEKKNYSLKKLTDPLKGKNYFYLSNGREYTLKIFPEVITTIPIYNKIKKCYYVHKKK